MVSLHDALSFFDLGIAVVPTKRGRKEPACRWSHFCERPPTEDEIRQWFGSDKRPGLAVISGPTSRGLAVRDFDDVAAYERWAADYPDLSSRLPTVETGRPGRHVYATVRPEQIAGLPAVVNLADGEARFRRCVSLAPPSMHPSGRNYRWLIPLADDVPVVDLDSCGWLPSDRVDRVDRGCGVALSTPSTLSTLSTLSDEQPTGVQLAIVRSLPSGPGQRSSSLFRLARELKSIAELRDKPVRELKPIVKGWHALALPQIRTKEFEESWVDFAGAWKSAKYAAGEGPVDAALARAISAADTGASLQYDLPGLRLLVRLCRELQANAGSDPFFLSCRTAGGLLGVDHRVAARWLTVLTIDGALRVEVVGTKATGKASRYRYLAE